MNAQESFPFVQYGEVVIGILVSIALPILRQSLPKPMNIASLLPANAVAASLKTYLFVGLFSLLTAILIVAFGGSATTGWQWYTAILAGYAWDSTLQKLVHG